RVIVPTDLDVIGTKAYWGIVVHHPQIPVFSEPFSQSTGVQIRRDSVEPQSIISLTNEASQGGAAHETLPVAIPKDSPDLIESRENTHDHGMSLDWRDVDISVPNASGLKSIKRIGCSSGIRSRFASGIANCRTGSTEAAAKLHLQI